MFRLHSGRSCNGRDVRYTGVPPLVLVTKVVTTEVVVTTPQKGYNLTRGVVTTLQGGCTSVTLCCVTALKFIHTLTTL
jgi:hypothetical protein